MSRSARIALVAACLSIACGSEPPAPDRLLLVTVDTLRADRIGAFGSTLGLTPHIDTLAAGSIAFSAAYAAAPFTLPSVSALLTGRYPESLGVLRNESVVPEAVPTLASTLRAHGFRTLAVVSNYILRRSSGIGNGFDEFDDTFPQLEAVRHWPERIAADTTDAALRLLDACPADGPCFLWVHYQDPHGPYTPPEALRESELARERSSGDADRLLPLSPDHTGIGAIPDYQRLDDHRDVAFYRAGYHAEIRYLDAEVGCLLRGVSERGLDPRSVIAFASDHGEGLGEDDYWFAHGEFLNEALVRVPLLLRIPGREPSRRNDVVATIDVLPTLLAALALPLPEPPPAGRNLLLPDAAAGSSRPYLATLGGSTRPRFGIVDGDYKFVISERDSVFDGRLTRRDREDVDLTAAAPQIAGSMRRRLQRMRAQMHGSRSEVRQELSEEEREKLRALGYVDESGAP